MDEDCRPKLSDRGRETFVGENPMLHCGLVLAGANQRPGTDSSSVEDGVVTAEEIAGLDLRGVKLVMLSACETGLGEVKAGEGVFGLRRAFQMAGARTVISTLWRVEDQSAAETIQSLLTEGFPVTPESSRRAMLKRLTELRASHQSDHPFFWAGYVINGDWK
jgi:CHAT domain-containing protein